MTPIASTHALLAGTESFTLDDAPPTSRSAIRRHDDRTPSAMDA
jgi:hypothetical protein